MGLISDTLGDSASCLKINELYIFNSRLPNSTAVSIIKKITFKKSVQYPFPKLPIHPLLLYNVHMDGLARQ